MSASFNFDPQDQDCLRHLEMNPFSTSKMLLQEAIVQAIQR